MLCLCQLKRSDLPGYLFPCLRNLIPDSFGICSVIFVPFLLDLVFGSLPEHRAGAGFSSSLQHCSAVASVQGFCHPSPPLASSLTRYQQLRNAMYSCCWFWSERLARGAELQSFCGRLHSGGKNFLPALLLVAVGGGAQGAPGGMGQTLPGEAGGSGSLSSPLLLWFVVYLMRAVPLCLTQNWTFRNYRSAWWKYF